MFRIYLASLIICLLITGNSRSAGAETVGNLSAVTGRADILKGGKLPAVAARIGDALSTGDIVRTKEDAGAEISFIDGNVLRIAQKSRVDISEYSAGARGVITLPRGKVEAAVRALKIAPTTRATRFEVRTPNAVAGVRGTDFFVYHDKNLTGVAVKEGSVIVFNPKFPDLAVELGAGRMTTVPAYGPPRPARPASDKDMKGHEKDVKPERKKDKEKKSSGEDRRKSGDGRTTLPGLVTPSRAAGADDAGAISAFSDISAETIGDAVKLALSQQNEPGISGILSSAGLSVSDFAKLFGIAASGDLNDIQEFMNYVSRNIPITDFITDTSVQLAQMYINSLASTGDLTLASSIVGLASSLDTASVKQFGGALSSPLLKSVESVRDLSETLDSLTYDRTLAVADRVQPGRRLAKEAEEKLYDSLKGAGDDFVKLIRSFNKEQLTAFKIMLERIDTQAKLDSVKEAGRSMKNNPESFGKASRGAMDNNPSIASAASALKADAIPPSLIVGGVTNGDTINPAKTSLDIKAADSNLKSVQYSIDGGKTWRDAMSSTLALDAVQLLEGANRILIRASDEAGNSTVKSYDIISDTTPPSLVSAPAPGLTNSKTLGFTLSSDTATYSYTVSNGLKQKTGTGTGSAVTLTDLPEGALTITITATDKVGNSTKTEVSVSGIVTDYTAPSILSAPAPGMTNSKSLVFTLSNDTASYSFIISNGTTQKTGTGTGSTVTLTDLPEGALTITITATDNAGNSSGPMSYSGLTTDYYVPSATVVPAVSPKAGATADITVHLSSGEAVTYKYKLDGGAWSPSGTLLTLPGLAEGDHALDIQAVDEAGNTASVSPDTLSFHLKSYGITGKAASDTISFTTAGGSVAAVTGKNWGGWKLNASAAAGVIPSSLTIYAGGESRNSSNDFSGYWLDQITGTVSQNIFLGTSGLTHLSLDSLGTGAGAVTGGKNVLGGFSFADDGSGNYHDIPLRFAGRISGSLYSGAYDPHNPPSLPGFELPAPNIDGSFNVLFGGTSSLSASPVVMLGSFSTISGSTGHVFSSGINSHNYHDDTFTTYDGSSYQGYISGGHYADNTANALVHAIYIDPAGNAGVLTGSLTGSVLRNIGMIKAEGNLSSVYLEPLSGILPAALNASLVEGSLSDLNIPGIFPGGGTFTYAGRSSSLRIQGRQWGVWRLVGGGSYSGTTTNGWAASGNGTGSGAFQQIEITGTKWSEGKVAGLVRGAWADAGSAATGISVGELKGIFDPVRYTYLTVAQGVFIETGKFLGMVNDPTGAGRAALLQLNIPSVEVGRVNLRQSAVNAALSNVKIDNAVFFAAASGARPALWASGSVSGMYTGNPLNQTVSLSGGGLSSDFTVKTWDTTGGKWLSTIGNGAGSVTGGGTNMQNLTFRGGAAGMINSGTRSFGGSAAGTVK